MIDINLVPPNLRKKSKGQSFLGGFHLPLEVIIGIGGGLVALLILFHVFLLFTNIGKMIAYKNLKKQEEQIKPQKDVVEAVVKELRMLQSNKESIVRVTGGVDRVSWSQKLNILSDSLPQGVWLRRVALSEKVLFIEGSAISRQAKENVNVHSFISNLKKRQDFLDHLTELELGSIQSHTVNKVDVADFLITAKVQ